MTPPETLTPRQMAERLGYKPSYGNQLAKEGRLVFAPDGKRVLVAESAARVKATADPSKQGVADRHAAGRGAAAASGPALPPLDDAAAGPTQGQGIDPSDPDAVPLYDFQNSKAKREHWAAEREHAEFRKAAGELMEHTQHIATMARMGAMVRNSLEAWAAMLPPQLAGREESAIRATLADQVEQILKEISTLATSAASQPGEQA